MSCFNQHRWMHLNLNTILYTNFQADSSIGSKMTNGSQKLEIRSPDPGHAHLGVVLYSVRRRVPSSISVPNMKRIAQFVQKLLRGPKIWKVGHVTPATPTWGRFMIRTEGGSVLYACTKFQADSSFRLKVVRSPNISKLGHVTQDTPI